MKMSSLIAAIAALNLGVFAVAGSATAQEREAGQQRAARGQQQSAQELKERVELPTHGIAVLRPSQGSETRGIVRFEQRDDALHLRGRITGLTPGKHGFHIHEFGDLSDPKGESAGGHFNPDGHQHGAPGAEEHHAGDFGNIEANQNGVAEVNIKAPWLKLHFVIGRALVVHGGADDLTSQPSGDAGPRAALGVIGIAQSPAKASAAKKKN